MRRQRNDRRTRPRDTGTFIARDAHRSMLMTYVVATLAPLNCVGPFQPVAGDHFNEIVTPPPATADADADDFLLSGQTNRDRHVLCEAAGLVSSHRGGAAAVTSPEVTSSSASGRAKPCRCPARAIASLPSRPPPKLRSHCRPATASRQGPRAIAPFQRIGSRHDVTRYLAIARANCLGWCCSGGMRHCFSPTRNCSRTARSTL